MSPKTLTSPAWYRIAVQALVVLAQSDGHCPSATIAENLETHAVFLRRVLAHLARVQIVEAREGRDGGYRLVRPAERITLGEIYRAVRQVEPDAEVETDGCLSARVKGVLDELGAEAELRALEALDRFTVADVIERAGIPETHG